VAALSVAEVAECEHLTLAHSLMRPALQRIRGNMRPHVRNLWMLRTLETESVVLLRRGRILVAWALVQCVNPRLPPTTYMFVHPQYRRRGLGSRLMRESRRNWPQTRFCPWDEQSALFFETRDGRASYTWEGKRFMDKRRAGLVS
jgi:GNAT superfamily N-acetyltransferase